MATKPVYRSRERDAKKAALDKGLKEDEFEIIKTPKGFTWRMKVKYEKVEGAKVHVGEDADKTLSEVLHEPVPDHPHIFKEKSNGRFRWADETEGLSQESFETITAAEAALNKYVDEELAPDPRSQEAMADVRTQTGRIDSGQPQVSNAPKADPAEVVIGTAHVATPAETEEFLKAEVKLMKQVNEADVVGTGLCPTCKSTVPVVALYTPGTQQSKEDPGQILEMRFTDHGNPNNDDDCPNSFEVVPVDLEIKPIAPPSTGIKPGEMAAHEVAQVSNGATAPGTATHAGRLKKSLVPSPSKTVWDIADKMMEANPKTTRKEVIAEAVKTGIAFYTARTQYQLWLTARRESIQHAEEVNRK